MIDSNDDDFTIQAAMGLFRRALQGLAEFVGQTFESEIHVDKIP